MSHPCSRSHANRRFLADVDAVAFQDLRKVAHEDGRFGAFDRIGEQYLAFLRLELPRLFVDFGLQPFQAGERHLFGCHPFLAGHVPAMPANRRQHLVSYPAFELVSFGLAGAEHEDIQAGFVDDIGLTLTP